MWSTVEKGEANLVLPVKNIGDLLRISSNFWTNKAFISLCRVPTCLREVSEQRLGNSGLPRLSRLLELEDIEPLLAATKLTVLPYLPPDRHCHRCWEWAFIPWHLDSTVFFPEVTKDWVLLVRSSPVPGLLQDCNSAACRLGWAFTGLTPQVFSSNLSSPVILLYWSWWSVPLAIGLVGWSLHWHSRSGLSWEPIMHFMQLVATPILPELLMAQRAKTLCFSLWCSWSRTLSDLWMGSLKAAPPRAQLWLLALWEPWALPFNPLPCTSPLAPSRGAGVRGALSGSCSKRGCEAASTSWSSLTPSELLSFVSKAISGKPFLFFFWLLVGALAVLLKMWLLKECLRWSWPAAWLSREACFGFLRNRPFRPRACLAWKIKTKQNNMSLMEKASLFLWPQELTYKWSGHICTHVQSLLLYSYHQHENWMRTRNRTEIKNEINQ